MLEELKKIINQAIEKQDKIYLMDWKLESVEQIFMMKYLNDWLKYNAMNEEELKNIIRFENHFNNLIKNLYVPRYE